MTTSDDTARRFWSFSHAVYAKPGVAPACLALQDDLRLDVNVLLFCCFAAAEGAPPLDCETLAIADTAIAPWRAATVAPLRAVRRAMKAEFAGVDGDRREAIRKQVQATELECERIVQSVLAVAVPFAGMQTERPEPLAAAASSLANYLLSMAGAQPTAGQWHHLAILLVAAIPGADETAAAAALNNCI